MAAADLTGNETVVEFGPGLGVLTRELARNSARVVAVELDRRLLPVLAETTADLDNVEILNQDALEFDYPGVPAGSFLIANLPYNVATPLITRSLESGRISRLVVMVQREVAERLRASVGDSGYGAYSVLIRHYAEARIVRDVSPGSFLPAPKVTSSIVRLDRHADAEPDRQLFTVVRAAFAHRRKTLRKNLMMSGYPEGTVLSALDALQLDVRVRAEQLSLAEFRRLSAALSRRD